MNRPLAALEPRPDYVPPWFTRLAPGRCHAGRSGGWASGRGTTPCRFRSLWRITIRSGKYDLCGTHLNAAIREEGGPTAAGPRFPIEWIGGSRVSS